jgi:hypothetical protein
MTDDELLAEYNRLTSIENDDWGQDEDEDWYVLTHEMTHRLVQILEAKAWKK